MDAKLLHPSEFDDDATVKRLQRRKSPIRICLSFIFAFAVYLAIDIFKVRVLNIGSKTPLSPPVMENRTFLIGSILLLMYTSIAAQKYQAWPYFIAYLLPLLTYQKACWGHYDGALVEIFVIIPILELGCGDDTSNPTREESEVLAKEEVFKWIPILWGPMQTLLLIWGVWFVWANAAAMTWMQCATFGAGVGFTTGAIGINIAHELIHKPSWLERMVGKLLLVEVWYGHFFIEHLDGHHKRVSTPDDPATSRKGEIFYTFWVRSVVNSFLSAWELEHARLQKRGYGLWSVHNQMLHFVFSSLALTALAGWVAGGRGVLFFIMQSLVAFTMLEIVNYIEHYGLQRAKKSDGVYEPVNILHSWNADTRVTNFFLFKLQRHSDHHAYAGRRYQVLRSFAASPQMPTGYAGMITLALFPPLWFRVMDPKVEEFRDKLAKYGENMKRLRD